MPKGADILAAFDFDLPEDRIARHPPIDRDGGRLLDLTGTGATHRAIRDLPELLRSGDLLLVNDTRVLPARLHARRASGGSVELLFLGSGEGAVEALVRPARKMREGEVLSGPDGASITIGKSLGGGRFVVETSPPPSVLMERFGAMPLPPYLDREEEPGDRERYQTVFAREPGAAAAPTAGLHFTPALLERLRVHGVEVATITLHVGLGTFLPLRPDDLERGTLHPERFSIPTATAEAIQRTRGSGGRVVACGTTVIRALESSARADGQVRAGSDVTTLFLREGSPIRVVDLLFTNFHLPRSSLLLLVTAFGGRERVMAAYREAVDAGYRFYSYGDAMLLSRAQT